jgi:transcriptional regulator with PAS, ATPase and Fis domain
MYPELVGTGQGLAVIMPAIRLAAGTDANVLIQGETGTGKELVAHACHEWSRRRHGPFIVANCAAIPHELMESELFGHVRGAYTGAFREHRGYFEAARGGTLLLDEIGDLHPDLQAKMLHVVESATYRKVGSTRAEHHDARLISATNRPLSNLIDGGGFRADLYYRVNVLTISIPSLRERGADVLELARTFLAQASRRDGREVPELTSKAERRLLDHSWPGNVRELKNCMERVSLQGEGPVVDVGRIERVLEIRRSKVRQRGVRPLSEVERDAIEQALWEYGGNRTRAARALGISRRTLQIKLKRYALMAGGAQPAAASDSESTSSNTRGTSSVTSSAESTRRFGERRASDPPDRRTDV